MHISNQNIQIQNEEKFDNLIEQLYEMGYGKELEEQETNEDIIKMLEKHHLHEQNFDFPEGNWENFKTSVLAGKYDYEPDVSDNNSDALKEAIKRYLKGECKLNLDIPYEIWLQLKEEALQEMSEELHT